MKTLITFLLSSLSALYGSAYTVKYTYNEGGGITSRTLADNKVKSRIASENDNSIQIESAKLNISVDSDCINVSIVGADEMPTVSYVLSNMMGLTMLTGTLPDRINAIDISHLASGTYVIYFTTSDNTYSRKLIKP